MARFARRRVPLPSARTRAPGLLGPGRSLDERMRTRMESRLGHDLGDVRLHDDERAAFAARTFGARAFAVGREVVLGSGATSDERILAHELAHVVQQERHGSRGDPEAGARLAEARSAVSPGELGAAPRRGHGWPRREAPSRRASWARPRSSSSCA